MDETVTVTKSEWEALQARCSEAEERASIETQLRKAVTEEMRKLQRKYAAQSAAPSNGELAATRARLRYLLKSDAAKRAGLHDPIDGAYTPVEADRQISHTTSTTAPPTTPAMAPL